MAEPVRPDAAERPQAKGGWSQRAFVSAGALLLGLTLPITGLLDHVVRDREGAAAVARWSVAHISLSVLFVAFCAWHIALNRRALARYLRARDPRALPAGEVLVALALVAAVLALTVTGTLG